MITHNFEPNWAYKLKKNKKFSVRLRLYDGQEHFWSIGIYVSKGEWKEVNKKEVIPELLSVSEKLQSYNRFVKQLLTNLTPFDLTLFDRFITAFIERSCTAALNEYLARKITQPTEAAAPVTTLSNPEPALPETLPEPKCPAQIPVFYFVQEISKDKEKKSSSTADSYMTAVNSLLRYYRLTIIAGLRLYRYEKAYDKYKRRKELNSPVYAAYFRTTLGILIEYRSRFLFADISVSFLSGYQAWMEKEGYSITSVGIYLRNIRHAWNLVLKSDPAATALYPFGEDKYRIPEGKNVKKAEGVDTITQIFKYLPDCDQESKAVAFWKLTFLSQGLNMKDIAVMRFSNIINDHIVIRHRQKIRNTLKKDIPPIIIYLSAEIKEIIAAWGNAMVDADDYLFPIVEGGLTERALRRKVQNFTKWVNKWMRKICRKLGISGKFTTTVARHSWASWADANGKSLRFIMEALGQTSVQTTIRYLKSILADENKKYALDLITMVKNGKAAEHRQRKRVILRRNGVAA